jgi:hypothetical protein
LTKEGQILHCFLNAVIIDIVGRRLGPQQQVITDVLFDKTIAVSDSEPIGSAISTVKETGRLFPCFGSLVTCSGRMPKTIALSRYLFASLSRRPLIGIIMASLPPGSATKKVTLALFDPSFEKVHWRAANEARSEQIRRIPVESERIGYLHDHTIAQDANPIAHRHRLDLIMRDINHCVTELSVKFGNLGAHLDAHLGGSGALCQSAFPISVNQAK